MRSLLLAGAMMVFTVAAWAQTPPTVPGVTTPSAPSLPTGNNPAMATPGTEAPSGTSLPGTSQPSNPIDQAKTEAECKIPTNATKPECVQLMLKK